MRPLPTLPESSVTVAAANRSRCCALHRAYPPALVVSTLMAGLFCYLYLTKPVVEITQVAAAPASPAAAAGAEAVAMDPPASAGAGTAPGAATPAAPSSPMLHQGPGLPGDPVPKMPETAEAPPRPAAASGYGPGFEETNIRIQHALSAEGPDGELGRILLEVPVLYESRRLRWTPALVTEARQLQERLRVHQENLRAVRQEAANLLAAWNYLIERSIPDDVLRADSPSLPVNQAGGHPGPSPAGLDTSETIRVSSSEAP